MTILKDLTTPIFKAEGIPKFDRFSYHVEVFHDNKLLKIIPLTDIMKLPQTTLNARMTSVSGWSVRADWNGVLWKDMMTAIGAVDPFEFVIFENTEGTYTTNCYKEDILPERWIVCHSVGGEPLEVEYGGPLRMIVPNLWGYKSCKWLGKIRFCSKNESGYWETRGYTDRGQIEEGTTKDVNTGEIRDIAGGEVTAF